MVTPKPVKLTQVDAASYDGAFEPEPLIIVGPIPGGGGGGGGAVDSVNGKTGAVVLSAGDVGARAVGNVPWADVSGKPATFAPIIGTTATTAVAGNDARLAKADTAVQPAAIANFVPNTRTVAGKALTGNVTLVASDVGAATAAQGALAASAVQPAGLTKAAVGLGNVDNTSDAAKPVSTAQQTALNLKAPLASPAFTGTPTGITKAHVGLGSVDNTSDANKPVSTAQAAAIAAKVGSDNASVTGIEYYATAAELPQPGTEGVIYCTKSA